MGRADEFHPGRGGAIVQHIAARSNIFLPSHAIAPVAKLAAALPTPAYVYDSTRRAMRFYRSDDNSREMFAYFARG